MSGHRFKEAYVHLLSTTVATFTANAKGNMPRVLPLAVKL